MKSYYTLKYDMDKYEKYGMMIYHNELYGIDMYSVTLGKYVEMWDDRISFTFDFFEGDVITDYICNDLSWFIISEKFKSVLEDSKIRGIQYLPVNIINKSNGKTLGNYFVANIYNLIEGIDMEKSECIELGKDVFVVISPVIKEENIKEYDIFRLKRDEESIFISEKLKRAIEVHKITGCAFEKVQVS